ncbi:MAG: TatD family hydrolase [Rhizobacter sp.]|nr:TatD family hydrolase [Chlorobiales bacterium]
MFVDVHSHLAFSDYDADREDVIARLKETRVSLVINPGTNIQTSREAVALAEQQDFVYANVGLHPCDVADVKDEDFITLESLARHPKVVAIGEIGLDYHYPETDKSKEALCFREMLRMAKRLDLPVVIHTRDAWEDTFKILEEEKSSVLRGVMHCFSGTAAEAERCIRLGFKLSIPGVITFKKSNLPEVVAGVPLASLLTETDAPYLAPVPHRGKRNEPAFVIEVARKIAEVKSLPLETVAEQIRRNAAEMFRLDA